MFLRAIYLIGFVGALLTTGAAAETPLERGAYLVKTIGACGNCHTPKGARGVPIADKEMAGGFKFDEKPFTAYASNITPDPETGIGKWTDQQIIDAIRKGKRPDGSTIGPPMPIELYRDIAEDDVKAIVAYLRSLKPVKNKVPKSVYRIPLPPSYGPVTTAKTVSRGDKVAYGAYLAGPIGHCTECHSTPDARGVADFKNGLGGRRPRVPRSLGRGGRLQHHAEQSRDLDRRGDQEVDHHRPAQSRPDQGADGDRLLQGHLAVRPGRDGRLSAHDAAEVVRQRAPVGAGRRAYALRPFF